MWPVSIPDTFHLFGSPAKTIVYAAVEAVAFTNSSASFQDARQCPMGAGRSPGLRLSIVESDDIWRSKGTPWASRYRWQACAVRRLWHAGNRVNAFLPSRDNAGA